MRLIGLAVVLAVSGILTPLAAHAQQAGKMWQIGVLSNTSPDAPRWMPFREGLRESGYIEGQNIAFEWRSSYGRTERYTDLANDLLRLKVDVIVAVDNPTIAAAQKATRTTPIVMILAMDPVTSGFVGSLARPGGNITGLSTQSAETQGKTLQLLKEAVPSISRVGILWDPTEPGRLEVAREAEGAARALGLHVQLVGARRPADLESVFAAMARDGVDGVLVQSSQMIGQHRPRIAELAIKHRLPTIGIARWFTEPGPAQAANRSETPVPVDRFLRSPGGLLSYGPSYSAQYRRAAQYVAKLLGGSKAADLPVEQPTKFELVINLKTAKALGLTIPQSLLLRADQVIE